MNTRDYKQFCAGNFFHVFNRGTAKTSIFCDHDDYLLFLSRLKENIHPMGISIPTKKYGYIRKVMPAGAFDLLCYCLMPNHFHLLLRQNTDVPISKLISKVCTSYSKCFNKKYGRVGSLFQDQFKSVAVESNEQLLWLSAYIHKNPLKGRLVDHLPDYVYSSYREYIGGADHVMCKTSFVMDQCKNNSDAYIRYVMNLNCERYGSDFQID